MFSQYVLIVVWLGFVGALSGALKVTRKEIIDGVEVERIKWFYAIIIFLPIVFMAGYRCNDFYVLWQTDTGLYRAKYFSMPNSFSGISGYLDTLKKDKGFYYLSAVLHVLLGNQRYETYFLILAAFQGFSLIRLYKKYSSDYIFSIFLFVASSDYISWMFNGVRQFMATTIMLLATPLFLKEGKNHLLRKYIPIVGIILIASTMHRSALLMIPIVIIAQGKA